MSRWAWGETAPPRSRTGRPPTTSREQILAADDLFGEPALVMVDAIIGGAIDCGRTPEQAVELYRSVWYYMLGEILVRARRRTRRVCPAWLR